MNVFIKTILSIVLLFMFCRESRAQKLLPSDHFKYRTIFSVCQRISAAKGDVRKMPNLEVRAANNAQAIIAQFKWQPVPKIIVDEKIYDLCKTFGKDSLDALACILGHELAHYYENHNNPAQAAASNSLASNDSVSLSIDNMRLEAQADYFGLFYGFLAGYDTFRLLTPVLNTIYQEYNLPQQLSGYPTKEERLNTATKTLHEVAPLLDVFQAAQILFVRKNYQEAAVCYNYLLTKFPAREIYNNCGVTKLAQAVTLMKAGEVYFAYPFEIDAETRLKNITTRSTENTLSQQKKVDSLLLSAQHDFEKAITIDESYLTAYLNLASTYSLQGNQEAAIGKINELERFCSSSKLVLPANAYLIKGIARLKMRLIDQAQADFELAFNKKASLAPYNLALYKKIRSSWQDKLANWLTHWPVVESWIEGFWKEQEVKSASGLESLPVKKINLKQTGQQGKRLLIADALTPISILNVEDAGKRYLTIGLPDYSLIVYSAFPHETDYTMSDIIIGNTLAALLEKYGKPTSVIATSNGMQYYYYEAAQTIVELKENRVSRWHCYSIRY